VNNNASVSLDRIMLAGDDPSNPKVTQLMLERLGYEVDAVTNGLEVLQALEDRTSAAITLIDTATLAVISTT
jgi:CheY-like chemotaxis protein